MIRPYFFVRRENPFCLLPCVECRENIFDPPATAGEIILGFTEEGGKQFGLILSRAAKILCPPPFIDRCGNRHGSPLRFRLSSIAGEIIFGLSTSIGEIIFGFLEEGGMRFAILL